jgi:hypothetical protein
LESESEEEEVLEHRNNIRAYRQMVNIVASTTSSPAREHQVDQDDDDYVEEEENDDGDAQDEESEQEMFEDIPDYEAEMERSRQASSSQRKLGLTAVYDRLIDRQRPLSVKNHPLSPNMIYGINRLWVNVLL